MKPEDMKYVTITAEDRDTFDDLVNDCLRKGWRPYGSPHSVRTGRGYDVYRLFQAMVMPEVVQ